MTFPGAFQSLITAVFAGSMDIPFLRAPEDWRQEQEKDKALGTDGDKSGMFIDEDNPLGFDDDDGLGGFDLGGDVQFGEGGEAWAREAALEPQMRVYDAGHGDEVGADGDGVEMLDDQKVFRVEAFLSPLQSGYQPNRGKQV